MEDDRLPNLFPSPKYSTAIESEVEKHLFPTNSVGL